MKRRITVIICLCISILIVIFLLTRREQVDNGNNSYELKDKSTIEVDASSESTAESEIYEKGYDLPIDKDEEKAAKDECRAIVKSISDIFKSAKKIDSFNIELSEKEVNECVDKISLLGYSVTSKERYANMQNYKGFDMFLKNCINKKAGVHIIYEVLSSGGICRKKYIFDGADLYVLSALYVWEGDNDENISITYDRIKNWKYTESGWFGYELCVPEYPEVTEMVDGACLIRVLPLSKQKIQMSKKYVSIIAYQGNNLLCSNWDENHLKKLDYNGLFEYLYLLEHKEKPDIKKTENGIRKEEFENLMTKYLPVSKQQLQKYAQYDKKNKVYLWKKLGYINYTLSEFGTSYPEVVKYKNNSDGTVTLTVNAVCEMILYNEAVITHELTIKENEDGSFTYLGNKILSDDLCNVPDYQYRVYKD